MSLLMSWSQRLGCPLLTPGKPAHTCSHSHTHTSAPSNGTQQKFGMHVCAHTDQHNHIPIAKQLSARPRRIPLSKAYT